jgi:hypothetical protein
MAHLDLPPVVHHYLLDLRISPCCADVPAVERIIFLTPKTEISSAIQFNIYIENPGWPSWSGLLYCNVVIKNIHMEKEPEVL